MPFLARNTQLHSPTLHAFLNGLHNSAHEDDVISTADRVHKRVRYSARSFREAADAQRVCSAHSHHGARYP
eukprot:3152406-Pleurochrysis_carterae.AAC.1